MLLCLVKANAYIYALLSFISFCFCLCCVQAYSIKVSDSRKLASYFVYIAKGISGKRGDRVRVLFESEPRPWAQLHEQFHDVKEEREAARAAAPPSDFYHLLAERCKEQRKTSKEDVLSEVVKYTGHLSLISILVLIGLLLFIWRLGSSMITLFTIVIIVL